MNEKMEKVVRKLEGVKKTISTMESCTGGGLANAITNIEGASGVLKFSAVTYSNEFKIKMGVKKDTISEYTVYSREVAREMAYSISKFAGSNYGVGITGKLMCQDENNQEGDNNLVYVSIYDKDNLKYYDYEYYVYKNSRELNKEDIIINVIDSLVEIIK